MPSGLVTVYPYPVSLSSLCVLLMTAAPVITSTAGFTEDQITKLKASEIIVERGTPPDGKGVSATMMALVKAPVKAVIPAIHDCEHFHEFVPRTVKSEERSRKGNHRVCFVEVEMPFPLSNVWSVADVYGIHEKDGRFTRRWYTKEGSFKKNEGSWSLIPWGPKKHHTLAIYQVETEPDIAVPNFIIRSAQGSSLPKLMKAIRNRVAR